MCRCAAAIARAVVSFLDAVLVGCFLSWFRAGPVAGHRDPLVQHRDRPGEALSTSDEEKGFGGSRGSHEHSEDGRDTDEELRQECDYMPNNALAIGETSVSGFNSSECFKCEEDHTLMTEIEVPEVESVLHEKSLCWSIKRRFSDCSGSPFPTPLVLRDDMQTPGTVYTSHTGSSMSRKRVHTRKQFVYPVLRPIENKLQQVQLTGDSSPMVPSNAPKQINLGADYIKKLQHTSSNPVAKVGFSRSPPVCFPNENASYQEKETLSPEELKCQTSSLNLLEGGALSMSNSDEKHATLSLIHWLKPSSPDCENQGVVSSSASDQLHDENTLFTESPVFTAASGMDADVENPTPTLPKARDPNTTTKYKEACSLTKQSQLLIKFDRERFFLSSWGPIPYLRHPSVEEYGTTNSSSMMKMEEIVGSGKRKRPTTTHPPGPSAGEVPPRVDEKEAVPNEAPEEAPLPDAPPKAPEEAPLTDALPHGNQPKFHPRRKRIQIQDLRRQIKLGTRSRFDAKEWACPRCSWINKPQRHLIAFLPPLFCECCNYE